MEFDKLTKEVGLSLELTESFLTGKDIEWLMGIANFYDGYSFAIKIGTKEEGFTKAIADADKHGCSQKLISVLKHAKGMGIRWLIISRDK